MAVLEGMGSPGAAEAATTNYVMNRPLHRSLATSRWGGKISRGAIMTLSDGLPLPQGMLRFSFNPERFQTSYSINESINPLTLAEFASTGAMPEGGFNLAFNLEFDRTYELASDPDYAGCWDDARTLLNLVGVKEDGLSTPRFVTPRLMRFFFGNATFLKFEGAITALTIDYTSFTSDMRPKRCVMGISVTARPNWQWADDLNREQRQFEYQLQKDREQHLGGGGGVLP